MYVFFVKNKSSHLEGEMNTAVKNLLDLHLALALSHPVEADVQLQVPCVGHHHLHLYHKNCVSQHHNRDGMRLNVFNGFKLHSEENLVAIKSDKLYPDNKTPDKTTLRSLCCAAEGSPPPRGAAAALCLKIYHFMRVTRRALRCQYNWNYALPASPWRRCRR